jgi:hypothetical protein
MFIIIYLDGNHVIKYDIETAFSLPGNHYIFSVHKSSLQMNKVDGICYYNKNKEADKFRINHLELIDLERMNSSTPFRFSIYDHTTDSIKKITAKSNIMEYALSSIIKTIISASQFPSWETMIRK